MGKAKPTPTVPPGPLPPTNDPLSGFLPAVQQWFRACFANPSPAQAAAWPVIGQGDNLLLLAPTGSGKTLAAFLAVIDQLLRAGLQGRLNDSVYVVYVTPLKALGNDIHRNLLEPLAGIQDAGGGRLPELRVAVRTGDTPAAERARMIRRPPHILITTPESLYLLLASQRLAPALGTVERVIVDEVHALCDSKRGVHLALSLERLAARVRGPLQRLGCSATLNPLDDIARFLCGYEGDQPRPCRIVDVGAHKELDLAVVLPLPEIVEASHAALWSAAYELLLAEIRRHRTTLIFCNSRYKAERTWLRLNELAAGEGLRIGVHHGSMSRETRREAELALKTGELAALVATGSLELGIDIGSIDLVYQLESPASVATALQRIGRAGHLLGATSTGRILVFDRDELFEAAAICQAMVQGQVEAAHLPAGCLDVLAQQIAGAVAAGDWELEELLACLRRAAPYHHLSRGDYEDVVAMLSGEPGLPLKDPPIPLVLWDRPTGRLRAARSAAHVTAMNVGTIADASEYDVVIGSSRKRIGRIQAEFVDDTLRHDDVFVLGNAAWRVTGKQRQQVWVEHAPAATPTVPWWQGGFEPRSLEVGRRVGQLRRAIATGVDDPALPAQLQRDYRVSADAALAMVAYVREQQLASSHVPDHEHLLVETWTDELGRLNHIIHCPLGQRLNQAWAEALVAALQQRLAEHWSSTISNDIIVLAHQDDTASALAAAPSPSSPGPGTAQAGASLSLPRLLALVGQATLAPLLAGAARRRQGGAAFRQVAVCALQVRRAYGGKSVPVWLQNYRAEELAQAASDHPEHPLFREVRRAFLEDSLESAALAGLLEQLAQGRVRCTCRRVESPSPFVHSLLIRDAYRGDHAMGRDRRAQLLRLHRRVLQEVLSTDQLAELLDPRAIDELEERLGYTAPRSRARSSDELAQLIRELGAVPADLTWLGQRVAGDPVALLEPLLHDHRVVAIVLQASEQFPVRLVTADRWRTWLDAGVQRQGARPQVQVVRLLIPSSGARSDARWELTARPPAQVIARRWRAAQPPAAAQGELVERYLRSHGPVTLYDLVEYTGLPVGALQRALHGLVAAGQVAEGVYRRDQPRPQWVNRTNLAEIHRRTLQHLRHELSACAPHEAVDYLLRWQHRHPATRLEGLDGLRTVIRQLQGYEVIQGVLEPEVLAGRVVDYQPEMLERLMAAGEVCWRRVHPSRIHRAMVTLCYRGDLAWLVAARPVTLDGQASADLDLRDEIRRIRTYLRDRGTAWFDDIVAHTGVEPDAAERAVWHLAWCGELLNDTYEGLRAADFRATLSACYDLATTPRNIVDHGYGALGWNLTTAKVVARLRRLGVDPRLGRWYASERLQDTDASPPDPDWVLRCWADQLLDRWGILTRSLLAGEVAAPEWAQLLPELKRRELLGQLQRGYYIEAHPGEQYGLPAAIDLLRDCRGRHGTSGAMAYLPGEPVLAVTSREPANLYASSLDITRGDGTVLARHQRAGNSCWSCVLQSGQVLVYEDRQLMPLPPEGLRRCLEVLTVDELGRDRPVSFARWNGLPAGNTPAAAVMAQAGFGLNRSGAMVYPPPPAGRTAPSAPAGPVPELLAPFYAEEVTQAWDRTSTLALVDPERRSLLAEVLSQMEQLLPPRGWALQWHADGLTARYRSCGLAALHIGRRWLQVGFHAPPWRDGEGRRQRIAPWAGHRLRVTAPQDLDDAFASRLLALAAQVEEAVAHRLGPAPGA